MFDKFLDIAVDNPILASIVVLMSTFILFLVCVKPLLYWMITKTQTKRDDEIVKALYKAIEEHKEEVEAIHKTANKIKEKKCSK